jgi:hypothetical protein
MKTGERTCASVQVCGGGSRLPECPGTNHVFAVDPDAACCPLVAAEGGR